MKAYLVLSASSSSDLSDFVCQYIADGYIPVGGVAIRPETDEMNAGYFQAVILNTSKKNED